jgi:hypothetical protein
LHSEFGSTSIALEIFPILLYRYTVEEGFLLSEYAQIVQLREHLMVEGRARSETLNPYFLQDRL